jgi:hypothetical protein
VKRQVFLSLAKKPLIGKLYQIFPIPSMTSVAGLPVAAFDLTLW